MTTYEVNETTSGNATFADAQLIQNDDDILGRVDYSNDIDFYKVNFSEDGEANFYLNPLDIDLDVDLYIYDDNESLLESSLRVRGEHELITLNVEQGRYYYVKIKHYDNGNGVGNNYHFRCKNYPYFNLPCVVDHIPLSTPYNRRPGTAMAPEYLTIHSTANPNSTAQNERDWLVNTNNTRTASWHICVDQTESVEAIPFDEIAWHAGDGGSGTGNTKSIGLEISESGDRAITLQNAIDLAAKILRDYGWGTDKLKRHQDWSGKICPRILISSTYREQPHQTWDWFVNEVGKKL